MTSQPDIAQRRAAYTLTPKQGVAMDAIFVRGAEQLLYGGAAGGGKSGFMRALAYHLAQMWPGARIAIFRDNYTQLLKTQVVEWHKEMHALGYDIKDSWRATSAEWLFPNGSIVEFLHLDQSIGADKWLSAEWAAILVDEATQIGEDDHATLFSRVRVKVEVQEQWKRLADEREAAARAAGLTSERDIAYSRSDWRQLAVYATNPGGKSHEHFKTEFVDQSRLHNGGPWESRITVEIPGLGQQTLGLHREFVPSFLTDNPHINTLQYAATLAHLPVRRREQLMSGNWDYFEGQVFDMLSEEVHLVDARAVFGGRLAPPDDWPRLGGLDHGTQNPTAAIPMTREEDGFFIVGYWEYYAAGPNRQHIDALHALLMLDGRRDMEFESDPRMWHAKQGFARNWSVADEFAYGGEPPEDRYEAQLARDRGIRLRQSKVERVAARMAMERMFEPDPNLVFPHWHKLAGQHGAPRAFICKQAPNLWRELVNLKFVDGTEETVKVNDHAYDAASRVMPVFEQALYGRRRSGPAMQIGYR